MGHDPVSSKCEDKQQIRILLQQVMKTHRQDGDIWPSLLSQRICEYYEQADFETRSNFLKMLAKDFNLDAQAVEAGIARYAAIASDKHNSRLHAVENLRDLLLPPFEKFFTRVNQLPGGLHFLIGMRADVLVFLI